VWTMITAGLVMFEQMRGGLPASARLTLVGLASVIALFAIVGPRGSGSPSRSGRTGAIGGPPSGSPRLDDADRPTAPDREEVTR
jgi:hypothetical protein